MQPSAAVILASPYEAELCRRALLPTGARVFVADADGVAFDLVERERPGVLVLALDRFEGDPEALVARVRGLRPEIEVVVIAQPEGAGTAVDRLTPTQVLFRPVQVEALTAALSRLGERSPLRSRPSKELPRSLLRADEALAGIEIGDFTAPPPPEATVSMSELVRSSPPPPVEASPAGSEIALQLRSELSRAAHQLLPPPPLAPSPQPGDEGDLTTSDIASLLGALCRTGFSGRLTLLHGDCEKVLFFDAGAPIGGRSNLARDQLADLLLREGLLSREQHGRLAASDASPRAAAELLVGLGLLKSSERFETVRRHLEELFYSCFAWERGRFRLSGEELAASDRVRLSISSAELIVEGLRRKYGLERLYDRLGAATTVPLPGPTLAATIEECRLKGAERALALAIDGSRTIAELVAAAPALGEVGSCALLFGLTVLGALRAAGDVLAPVTRASRQDKSARDRRLEPRRERDASADQAIDRERLLAKRTQVQDGDYFAILGLSRDASGHEVARAFARLEREYGAERFTEPLAVELTTALREIREAIDEAHRVLQSDALRAAYRAHLP